MTNTTTHEAVWSSGKVKLVVLWFGLDALLYLGALLALVLALNDPSVRPVAYAFTILLVVSWASRMAYGIWLELGRLRQLEKEKTRKLDDILRKHGLSEDAMAAVAQEIKHLG